MGETWTDDRMDDLVQRVDAGFSQIHADAKEQRGEIARQGIEFRQSMKEQGDEFRQEMKAQGEEFRQEMKVLREEFRQEMKALRVELRGEMKELGTELRAELDTFRTQTNQQFIALNRRFDGLQATLLAAILAGLVGLVVSQVA